MTVRRGLLIAVEGCDRGGKTTQCNLLREWFLNEFKLTSEYVKFPERSTAIGKVINEYLTCKANLSDETIHLLFSANRWELKEKLESTLETGTSIVLDRYAHSGVAYSAAKGLDLEWCKAPDSGLPKPDLVVFLDVPIDSSATRDGFGGEKYEVTELQIKVRSQFDHLMDDTWIMVNGVGTIEQVSQVVQEAIRSRITELSLNVHDLQYLKW